MIVNDLIEKLGLKLVSGESGVTKEVMGGYVCDLLSFVMSHGSKGNVWLTVQVHPNIIAVAVLLELSCIIVPEEIEIEKTTIDKSNIEGIPLLHSKYNAYELCGKLNSLGI